MDTLCMENACMVLLLLMHDQSLAYLLVRSYVLLKLVTGAHNEYTVKVFHENWLRAWAFFHKTMVF